MKRILVPTDFSPHADAALAHAIRFARAFDGELHLLNVQTPFGPTSPLIEEFPDESDARTALMQIDTGGFPDVRQIRRGVIVAPAILEYAHEQDIDVIAIGSHGRRGVPRLLMGSVAEEVMRAAECPVLVVHSAAAADPADIEYGRILAPIDFSPLTEGQIETTAELARRFSAEIELVHAIDPPTMPDFYMPAGTFVLDMKHVTQHVYDRLEALAEPLEEEFTVVSKVLAGRAAKEISRRSKHADLIVIPTHGHTGMDRALLGSVAEAVIRRAPCPVVVLPADRSHFLPDEAVIDLREAIA